MLDSGTLHLAGQNITRSAEYQRATLVGRVFQNPFSGTAPTMSIVENIALATRRGRRRGFGPNVSARLRDEIRDRVRTLKMGLEDRIDNPIGTLSGGQRQALTLLMASWIKPDLLLLDEHTAALDPKSADQVIQLTAEIVARDSLTTLMVTHSMHQAANFGDRIIMMHKGQVVHDLQGQDRESVSAESLLDRFESIRRAEQLQQSANTLLRSAAASEELVSILCAVASADAYLDQNEITLLKEFADHWNVALPQATEGAVDQQQDLMEVRLAVHRYLALNPPRQEASELLDLLQHLIHADGTVSEEEEATLDEIGSMVTDYVTPGANRPKRELVIVPQTEEQHNLTMSLLPGVEAQQRCGGLVYPVGHFHSGRFANLIAKQYIGRGLFTTRLEP
jgi:putative ABC transport system ATP-binding protein